MLHVRILVVVRVVVVIRCVRGADELGCVVVALIRFAHHVRRVDGNGYRAAFRTHLREAERIYDVRAGRERRLCRRAVRVCLTCRQLRGEVIDAA